MEHTAQIEVLSKHKALMMADYLTDYGIDVTEGYSLLMDKEQSSAKANRPTYDKQ